MNHFDKCPLSIIPSKIINSYFTILPMFSVR